MYKIMPETKDRLIVMKASGKLKTSDYQTLRMDFDRLAMAASGPVRVLLDWTDLVGWDASGEESAFAMWAQEWPDLERLAIVASDKFIEDGLQISKRLPKTTYRHFQPSETAEARAWLTA